MKIWIGVDPGEKRIGLARSDALGMTAFPADIVGSIDELVRWLGEQEWEVSGLVVGLPKNMDGTEGMLAERSREFVAKLGEKVEIPIELWDERLSTEQAKQGARKGERLDARAAAIILQSYLDARR